MGITKTKEVTDTVLAIVSHPDDAELLYAGTLALLRERGWNVVLATMTSGDGGTATLSRQHLGHAFPQDNLLAAQLAESVKLGIKQ